jgi:hypothetical protein
MDRTYLSRTAVLVQLPSKTHLYVGVRAVHTARSHIANVAYAVFALLIVLLAFLPTGVSTTRQTISAYALSPEGPLLRVAFSCLAVGSLLAAYEFWRSIGGSWGRLLALLTGIWVIGDVLDTIVSVNPVGGHTLHGQIHAIVAVVAFSAVAATVLAFLGWLVCTVPQGRSVAVCASALALVAVVVELSITALSADSLAGTAERAFFLGALIWMATARMTVARSLVPVLAELGVSA